MYILCALSIVCHLWLNMQNFEKGHYFPVNFWIFKFEISSFDRVPLKIIQIFQLNLEKPTMLMWWIYDNIYSLGQKRRRTDSVESTLTAGTSSKKLRIGKNHVFKSMKFREIRIKKLLKLILYMGVLSKLNILLVCPI